MTDPEEGWRRFRRRGEVRAVRLDRPQAWLTESGDRLEAEAGDYWITDGSGSHWSARPRSFRASYAHVEGDRWRRTGEVLARRASPGEAIDSQEGREFAAEGDWIVEDEAGNRWIVPGNRFDQSYE